MDIGSKLTARDGEKLASKLALDGGESIVFVAFCSNWQPTALDRLVITNRRVLASPAVWPKVVWEAPLGAATCTASADEKSVTITPAGGESLTFKKVPIEDHAKILEALGASPAPAAEGESPYLKAPSEPAASKPPANEAKPAEKKQGMLAKAAAAAKRAAEEAEAQYARGAAQAGHLVLSKTFGSSTVEIYENGYVRVATLMTKTTPFEKLRSVKYTQQVQDKSAGGRALAGAATMGLNYLASKEKRVLFLTIATDRKVHSLTAGGDMFRADDKTGLSIEATAQGVLGAATAPSAPAPQVIVQAPAAPASQTDSLAEHIKKLADLRDSGILSEEEFNAAKQRLISG